MKRYGRFVAGIVFCALLCGMLGGCSLNQEREIVLYEDEPDTETEEVKLTFFGYKADARNLIAIEAALHGFMDENPDITVIYEGIKGTDYWDAFEKRAQTGCMDDMMMINHEWVTKYGVEGGLADLSDLPTIDNFNDMAKSQFTNDDGTVYFLPTCISTYGLYINYDLLEAHGQEIPTNMEEFTEVCNYFVGKGITPIVANNYFSLNSLVTAKGLYPIYQKEDSVAEIRRFNSGEADLAEALRPGMEMLGKMLEQEWMDCEEVLDTNQTSDDLDIFAEGDRPFMITGGWASPRLSALEPEFEYGIYPFPILEDGSVLLMDVNTCVSVNAESENVEAAKKLVSYMTQPDVMWEYCESQSSYTPLKDDRIPSDKTIAPCVEYLSNGRSVIGTDYNLTLPLDSALRECTTQMLKGMDADSAVCLLAELLAQTDAAEETDGK